MAAHEVNNPTLDSYVIAKVKEMRLQAGMSQAVLAVKMDVSQSFIGNAENPKKRDKYNLGHINKLAVIFSCSPKDFLPEKPL